MSEPRPAKIGPYRAQEQSLPIAMLAVGEARAALRRQAEEQMVPHLLALGAARRNGTVEGYIATLEETLQAALECLGLEP